MNEILQCSLEDFQGHYAPWQVPANIVDSVYALYVEDEEHSPLLVKQGDVADFVIEPMNAERPETDMFEKLKDTVNLLCESKVREQLREVNRTATLRYDDKGITSGIRKGTKLRVDAYLTVRAFDSQSEDFDHRDCSPEVDLADVAVVAEFKKHVKDNVRVSALCSSGCEIFTDEFASRIAFISLQTPPKS